MNRLSGRVARLMFSPGVGPTVPFATIESSRESSRKLDAGQALTVGFLLRIPAGGPDFLARAEQLVAMA